MIYHGRHIDVLALWGEYIDLPNGITEPLPTYLPKVQCPNPTHNTTKHHFQVNTKKALVHCFADCGISGTYEHAIAVITGGTDKDAKRAILRHSRAALKGEVSAYANLGTRKTITAEDDIVADQRKLDGGAFQWLPAIARGYLDRRGIDGPSIGKWQIGWDEDQERLVIPALDQRGTFRFLIRRRIDGVDYQKYLYTSGATKSSLLFGACYLDAQTVRSRGLVLNEGPFDPIRLHQIGLPIAVAILGTVISHRQARLIDKIGPKRCYLFFDKDGAGVDNIRACQERVRKVPLFVCRYPAHRSDPAEVTREEAERILDRALPINEFWRKARIVTRRKETVHVN